MSYQDHSELIGTHAILSPSNPAWLRYDDKKLRGYYAQLQAKLKGTELHALAASLIKNKVKLPSSKKTLNAYVNDCIGWGMTPEQIVYYSRNCYGTTDARCFGDGILRINDLKTGSSAVHPEQLEIYAALFCLEHGIDPFDIHTILGLYQSNTVEEWELDPKRHEEIMDRIVHCDQIVEEGRREK